MIGCGGEGGQGRVVGELCEERGNSKPWSSRQTEGGREEGGAKDEWKRGERDWRNKLNREKGGYWMEQ